MAIFHLAAKVVSRKAGQSVVAKAAYNAREELAEERTGEVKDYSRAQGLIFSGIYTAANAPEWAHDRAQLWNKADQAEKRKDATLAREYELALPHELTNEQRRFLVQDFVRESFTRKGYAADVAIHAPDREGDERNYHAHILVTDRRLEADGFAADKKERKLKSPNRKAELEAIREKWEHIANRHLERYGIEARIDRRSLKDQGIDREATEHLGPYATQLEREGEESERGNTNRDIEARNQAREEAQREYEAAQAEREQWEERIAQAAIQKAQEDQKKEREAKQDNAKNAELSETAANIRLAVQLSKSDELAPALKERCLVLSQVNEQEAAAFERAAAFAEELGHHAPRYNVGELVIMNPFGGIHRLTARTTGKTREDMEKYLAEIKRENLPNTEQGKKEAVLLGQEKQRAELLAKQEQQKAELEKQQAERKEQREKQAREFEEKAKQEIDGAASSKHYSDQFRLEKHLKENNIGFFGRTAARVKQFIGHKIDEHRAEQRKEKLHKTIVENEWSNQDRDEARAKRQDKAHERGQATVEIRQAEAREKMGIHAPERDEALKAAQRTNTEKAFSQSAAKTTQRQENLIPTEAKEAELAEKMNVPAEPKERKESGLDKAMEAVGKGREAIGEAGREAQRSINVIDKATGAIGGLSNGVGSILDGIARPVEAFAEGIASLFDGGSPAPPIHRRERSPTPDQIREAERALTNINQSLKRGDDIDAADLRNLPKSQLERIREGGDEYLMKMCQNWEIQQREREKEKERER
ncbi:MAG: MobQ family relaxase [Candidatus Competibacter sp.]